MATEGIVIDCSIAVAWCFPEEQGRYPVSVLDALVSTTGIVPSIWPLEVANALLMAERRRRSIVTKTIQWCHFLESLPLVLDDQNVARTFRDTLNLARAQNLSAYDAAYLELAARRDLPLATLDQKLKSAAAAVGVQLYRARARR